MGRLGLLAHQTAGEEQAKLPQRAERREEHQQSRQAEPSAYREQAARQVDWFQFSAARAVGRVPMVQQGNQVAALFTVGQVVEEAVASMGPM